MASHNQVIAIRPRSLSNVLDDLREARRDYDLALKGICTECHGDGGWDDIRCDPRGSDGTLSQWVPCHACDGSVPDADDRATEAETRVSDLRDEFAERFEEATGLTWRQIEEAVSEAVL